ncbi:ABC transporter substrate-binding protein [Stomatohabitans albus]|uniref:ABC transporter substrate-binding protein n=1 Tax=Stomatohabitans albus TaxID=3110766 RepID=UPI00300C92B0
MNRSAVLLSLFAALALSACTTPSPVDQSASPSSTGEPTSASASTSEASSDATTASATGKVMSCTDELTFDTPPKRVVMVGDDPAAYLLGLGVVDSVIGRGEDIPPGVYNAEDEKALNAIPQLEHTVPEGGGATVSTEVLLDQNPDLVISYDTGADRAALRSAGVPMYTSDQFCPDYKPVPASFDLVAKEYEKYGKIFGKEDEAKQKIDEFQSKVDAIKAAAPADLGSAMALYVTAGDPVFYTYGNGSMIHPIMETVGLQNVYANDPNRLIGEIAVEKILEENPDHIILLHDDNDEQAVLDTFLKSPGASDLKAVKENKVYPLPFVFTDPPSPTSVIGVEKLSEQIKK